MVGHTEHGVLSLWRAVIQCDLGDEGPAQGGDAHTDHGEAAGEVHEDDLVLRSEADHELLDDHSGDGDQS